MPHFDIVILGAGPAGASAAVTARKKGLSVALIDKARFPRPKLCGGLVTGRCATHLCRCLACSARRTLYGIGTGPFPYWTVVATRSLLFTAVHSRIASLERGVGASYHLFITFA